MDNRIVTAADLAPIKEALRGLAGAVDHILWRIDYDLPAEAESARDELVQWRIAINDIRGHIATIDA